MNDETLTCVESKDGSPQSGDGPPVRQVQESERNSLRAESMWPIAIASTFTADLLRKPLEFWMETLDISADITMAPYAQVMQELLNPESLLSQNKRGFNILLIRLEDWIRDRLEESAEQNLDHIRRVASDFVPAMGALRARTSAPTFIFFCPSSSSLPVIFSQSLEEIQRDLTARLGTLAHAHCWTHADLVRLYPVVGYEDARADRIGHIPYTNEYFVAIATLLTRRIAALLKPQYKVIAIDCDNTLWKGICGEDGAAGVELTPAHLQFQKMLVRQHDAGMLLCLCSKNNASDVEAVFGSRSEMPLREEHLICSRVNWNAKSSNLQSLSQELGLSLDSFILIDDSPIECAEVRTHCPSALTLQFPETAEGIEHFLDHVWAFDRIGVTEEAKQRTAQYKENRARNKALEETANLEQFLASLELKVDVSLMQSGQLTRVAELIQRTNQFNLTTIRRSSSDIEALWNSGDIQILVVHVRDRFGDYGLVGALFFRCEPSSIDVDTFVLSCRVLGRGVEHRIVNELGRVARQEGLPNVVLRYRQTPRNAPARAFLEKSFRQFRELSKGKGDCAAESVFTIPAEYAESLSNESAAARVANEEVKPITIASTPQSMSGTQWHEAAYRLSRISDLDQEINRSMPIVRRGRGEYVAPRTPTEAAVAGIWAEVLGLQQIGVRDDFFDMGGDSLLAVQAMAEIGSVLGLELSVYEFFEGPTVEEVASRLASASQYGPTIGRIDRTRPVPLSWGQQRLWFIDQLEGGSAAYHIPVAIRLSGGELDRAALQAALDTLIRRHEALRTVFTKVDGEPMQEIAPEARFALQLVDLRAQGAEEREAEVLRQSREELAAPFDLSAGPLIRGRLLQLSEDKHVLLITMHHIVSDGWSIGVLIRELGVLYEAYREGPPEPLPPLPIQYADYAQWQRQWLTGTDLQEQLRYWKQHLQGTPELLELPADRRRPAVQSYRGANVRVSLGSNLTADLKALSRRLNLTLAMTLCTAWSIVLSRLSGQEDIVVGMPVANRRRIELEGLIGFFANTLAVCVRLEDDPRVTDLLQRVKEIMLGAYAHQDVPFEQVVEALQPARSLSHSPIFQVMFALQNAPRGVLQVPGLTLTEQEVPLHTAQFDLTLSLQESAEGISGNLNYASDLFDGATIERWVGCFEVVLRGMVRESELKVSRLPLMSEDERRQVIKLFNATQVTYPQEKLIHELIEEQVQRTPDAVAVVYEGQSLTYAELNAKANQLARNLIDKGVGPDQLVGICVERSLEMVVGLLGILKAGGAYVPLDPNYPTERLQYMLKNAAPRVLLTQEELKGRLLTMAAAVMTLDSGWSEIGQWEDENLDPRSLGLTSRHLAYVIYTSGSTGQPKGAMNEHRALVNRLQWMQNQYHLSYSDRVLQKTPFSFDVSVWEFFWTLMSGARLIVARPQGHQDPAYLRELIEETGVTTLHFVPSMLQILLDQHQAGWCPTVRHIVCSGEELSSALQNRCLECLPRARLSNLYGPTEAAVDVTFWECQLDGHSSRVPVGRPISNTQMYVLDRHDQPVPIGVAGEIFIGGVGVGRGYLNRPELTAERFLPDPFSADPQARMYKTGDLGRWRVDGAIEYLGRNDHQVKIRGLRIELGEIEVQLVRHEQVKDAVVIAREDVPGEKRLVAYVVPDASSAPSVETLRAHLKAVLPEYMVPSAFVMQESLPLTPNGKLDRRALPAPELGAYASRQYEAPQGEVEEILAGIWQGLLRVERVGRHDNFFELGGHSLLIAQMMERLRRVGLWAELRRVYESPTLADLASALTSEAVVQFEVPPNLIPPACEAITPQMLPLVELQAERIEKIVQSVPGGVANIQDIYPLAPLQEGILFHHLLNEQGGDTYVLPTVLSVYSRERLEELIAALQAVIDRHDILRTAVLWEQLPRPVQVVCRQAILPVEEIALDQDRDPAEQIREWIKPERQRLDLCHAPLMRLRVAADVQRGQWYALLQLHHMTIDHVTLEIVTAEVVAHLMGRAQTLPESIPYRNHVAQALAYAETHDAEAFFRSKLAEIDEPTAPFGLLDVHGDGSQIEEAHKELELALAQRVRTQARRLGVSAATLFHAAWGLVVAHTSGRDDVVFGSVLLGRLQGNAGAQRILGMFINTLPLRLHLQGVTAKELVEQTQRELVELLSHEQASLATAQRCSGIVGSAPLFTTLLNYRHSVPNADAQWSSASGIQMLAIQERTNYPIALSVDDLGEEFTLTAQTDRRVDPHRMTGYLHTAVRSLVEALEQAPQTPALALAILPESERSQVVESFNATQAAYPQEKLIHELFEEQVNRTPDAMAVVYEGQSLTYAELNSKANQLARYLREQGVQVGEYIPILISRSLRMLVAQLAVLKSGGVYVPLDPELPAERRAFMIRDCGAGRILADGEEPQDLGTERVQWIDCAGVAEVVGSQSASNLKLPMDPVPPAYVMYTSGSTGMPKGVIVPHHAVNRLVINNGYAQIEPEDCLAHYSNPAFDASTFEIWGALLNGARVVIVPQSVVLEAERFAEVLEQQQVTLLWMSVGLFNQYTETLADVFAQLRYLIVGGDSLEPAAMRRVLNNSPPQHLLNGYGPTECTTFSTTHLIEAVEEGAKSIPIGRPISNAQIYILDSHRQAVPIGVAGEIYIGGAGVACGYLNRPELTAERFVADPFSKDPRARLYKTGDLGRWRADGAIEFLGRNDHQVKIRGFRIELGEIETQLARHAQVKEAVVIPREDLPREKRLVAYVIPRDPSDAATVPSVEELRGHLKAVLPEYMVPSAFVMLERMPLTPNGKLDRRALPAPETGAYASRQYEPPQGQVEEVLTRIWQELLQVERVGRQDNFFELGGHSLLVLKALFKINQSFGSALTVADAYRSPTIRELATRICGGTIEDDLVDLSREAALDDEIVAKPGLRCVPAEAVMLTGGTGFVGRFLLAQLLQDTDATIYCLVRAPSQQQALSRLRITLAKWDLWRDEFEPRIVAIPGDLRLPRLGIDEVTYQALCQNIDSIYHCATSMNHLETYAMAKPANVEAAKELLKLATHRKTKLINYISTLSVFSSSGTDTTRIVDEQSTIDHERHSTSSGYAASKWVGEKIFSTAGERGIPCNIFRLGLVWADTQQGRYDELQRDYRIFKSCLLSGLGIKNYRYDTVPTPVDYVARAVVFLANQHCDGQGIFHISSSSQMTESVFEHCNEIADTSLELLPLYDWICEIKRLHYEGRSLPVVPLIEFAFSMDEESFYEHQRRIRSASIRFDCARTQRELERADIVAPVLNDDLLRVCLESMLSRDAKCQELIDSKSNPMFTKREGGPRLDVLSGSGT